MAKEDYSRLEKNLGYTFRDKQLLIQAITHSTYAYERRCPGDSAKDNERLEFLGDGLLDFVIADFLFLLKPEENEGYLSKTRALIVCESTLAAASRDIELGDFLLLGRGESLTLGSEKPSNLANAMEALFAAVYLDGGFETAKEVIGKILSPYAQKAMDGELIFDYKSKILELAQTKGNVRQIRFEIQNENGPVHERTYTSVLYIDEDFFSSGQGSSKKLAEQAAAKEAYSLWKTRFL